MLTISKSAVAILLIVAAMVATLQANDTADLARTVEEGLHARDAAARPPAEQRAMYDRLVNDRLAPAARVAAKGEQMQTLRAQHTALVQQLATAGGLDEATWRKLLTETEQVEQRAVEQLAREYRIAAYGQFRTDRQKLEAAYVAWRSVENAWSGAGANAGERHLVRAWLQQAIRIVKAGKIDQLASIPAFGVEVLPDRLLAQAEVAAQDSDETKPAKEVEHEMPRVERSADPLQERLQEPTISAQPEVDFAPLMVKESARISSASVVAPRIDPIRKPFTLSVAREKERVVERNPPPRVRLRIARQEELPMPGLAHGWHNVAQIDRVRAKPAVATSVEVELAEAVEQASGESVAATIVAQTVRKVPIADESLEDIRWDTADEAVETQTPMARVNTKEVQARTVWLNRKLSELEIELQQSKQWTARDLARIMIALEDLLSRREDLALFHPLIKEREIPELASPTALLAQLQTRVTNRREHASSDAFAGTPNQRDAELELLDEIERRIVAAQ